MTGLSPEQLDLLIDRVADQVGTWQPPRQGLGKVRACLVGDGRVRGPVKAVTSLTAARASPSRLADWVTATGPSRRCTTSATSPSPKTPPRSAPAPPLAPWPACATSPSASCTPTATTIAAALRYYARDATRLLPLLGITPP